MMRRYPAACAATLLSIGLAQVAHADKTYQMRDEDVRTLDAAPFRPTAKAFKPTWCGKVPASGGSPGALGRTAESWFKYGGEDAIPQLLGYLCDAPDDPNVQKQAGYVLQAWMNWSGLSQDEAVASMLMRADLDGWKKLKEATCAPLVDGPEASAEQKEYTKAYRYIYGCTGTPAWLGRSGSFTNLVWYLDREADAPDLLRSFVAISRLGKTELAKPSDLGGPTSLGMYAVYGPDARRLDRARLDQQVGGGNAYATWVARETLALAQAETKGWDKMVADASAKDPDLKRVLVDAPEQAWKDWVALRKQEAAAFDAGSAFEDLASSPSKSAAKGCAATLRPHVERLIKGKAGADLKAVTEAIGKDPALVPLFQRYVLCEALEGNVPYATVLYRPLGGLRTYRGPRLAGFSAVVEAVGGVLADREKFVLQLTNINAPAQDPGSDRLARVVNSSTLDSEAQGTITTAKRVADGVLVTFKKESYMVTDWDCKPTGRVYRVRTDGVVEYEENCKRTGQHKVDTTAPSVVIPERLAAGVAKGKFLVFRPDHGSPSAQQGVTIGVPLAVFDAKAMTKLIAAWGFAL
ncbi:MAG: hypothetical protein IPL61_18190 [Myxococcales bacterium]|nr:hypothetical protein [Myxococcales bacterium]